MKNLFLKLMFKAVLSLVLMVGVLSYGIHLRGGDPRAVLDKVLGGMADSAKTTAAKTTDSIKALAPDASSSNITQVYKWVDENGVTHFGSTAPEGSQASSMRINNDQNVFKSIKVSTTRDAEANATLNNAKKAPRGVDENGEKLPGVAGMNLPTVADPDALADFLKSAQ